MRWLGCVRLHIRQEVGWDTRRWGPGYRTQSSVAGQPVCSACGGRLISSVVNFGDPLLQEDWERAEQHAGSCELLLVLGSSLVAIGVPEARIAASGTPCVFLELSGSPPADLEPHGEDRRQAQHSQW